MTQITVFAPLVSSNKFADELRFGDFLVLRGDTTCLMKVPAFSEGNNVTVEKINACAA